MILNVDEVVETVRKARNVNRLIIVKNYRQLGGWNNRFLPKDCYYPETGTAETAMYVEFSKDEMADPRIMVRERKDSVPEYSLIGKGLLHLRDRIGKIL